MEQSFFMRALKPRAQLSDNRASLGMAQRSVCGQILRQSLPLEILHAKKINGTSIGLRCVHLENSTHIVMSNARGGTSFGRQAALETKLWAPEGPALVQPFLQGLVDDAHPSFSQFPDDTEPTAHQVS